MIVLSLLLRLQLLYCLLGIGYNAVSYIQLKRGKRQLSTNSPLGGAAFMALYGILLLVGLAGYEVAYRVSMGLCLVVYGYGGIVKHVREYTRNPGAYSSKIAWLFAVGINSFGAVLNFWAVSGRFTMT